MIDNLIEVRGTLVKLSDNLHELTVGETHTRIQLIIKYIDYNIDKRAAEVEDEFRTR